MTKLMQPRQALLDCAREERSIPIEHVQVFFFDRLESGSPQIAASGEKKTRRATAMQRHQRQEGVLLGSGHDDFAGSANTQTPGFIDFSKNNLILYSSIFDAPACISTHEAIRSKTAIRSTSVIKLISAGPDSGGLRSPRPPGIAPGFGK